MTKLRVVSKGRVYPTVMGVAAGVILTGLVLPWMVGDVSDTAGVAATPGSGSSLPAGRSFGDDGGGAAAADSAMAAPEAGEGAPQRVTGSASSEGPAPAATEGAAARARSAEEVKLGVLIPDYGAIRSIGFGEEVEGHSAKGEREAFDAYIDLVNKSGGISGSPIVPYYHTFDPLRTETMDAACVALAQDGKVFAALAGSGFSAEHTLCLTERFGIPTHSAMPESEHWQARSRGLLLTREMTTHRMLRTVAQRAEQQGQLRGKTIGVVADESRPSLSATHEALMPSLARLGYEVAHTTVLSADVDTAARQMPTEIFEMRRKNVDLVLWTSHVLYFSMWINQADSQQFRPLYIASDIGGTSDDFGVQQAPESLEAIAYTGNRKSEYRANLPEPPVDTDCRRRYEGQTGKTLDRSQEAVYRTTIQACGWIDVFTAAARKAGDSLTRVSYVDSLRSLGPWEFPYVGPGSIQPGKLDLPDSVRTKQYQSNCRCWMPIDDFVPAAP